MKTNAEESKKEEKKLIQKSHDKLFKANMIVKSVAKSFIKNYLPEKLVNRINLKTLEIQKDSLIEPELTEYYMDLLYKVDLDNKEAYIYILFEHKSTVDKSVSLQLLKYMVGIWQLKSSKEKYPIIVPIVFYHGSDKWNLSRNFRDLFESAGINSEYIPDYRYLLCNVTNIPDEEIKGTDRLKAMILTFKYIRGEVKVHYVKKIYHLIKGNVKVIKMFTLYILTNANIEPKELKELTSDELSEKEGEVIMTTAERLISQGMERGIEKGKKENSIEVAKKMLKLGADIDFVSKSTDLSIKEVEAIKSEL